MICYDAKEIDYEKIELFGKECLLTELRIDRKTVPEGYNAYDLRDDGCGNVCEISDRVVVNHYGTILTKEEIVGTENGLAIDADNDINYLGEEYHF